MYHGRSGAQNKKSNLAASDTSLGESYRDPLCDWCSFRHDHLLRTGAALADVYQICWCSRWAAIYAGRVRLFPGGHLPGSLSVWMESAVSTCALAVLVSDLDWRAALGLVHRQRQFLDEHPGRLCHSTGVYRGY